MIRIIICTMLAGCSVIQTTHNEMKNELAGFKEDWIRTFHKEQAKESR